MIGNVVENKELAAEQFLNRLAKSVREVYKCVNSPSSPRKNSDGKDKKASPKKKKRKVKRRTTKVPKAGEKLCSTNLHELTIKLSEINSDLDNQHVNNYEKVQSSNKKRVRFGTVACTDENFIQSLDEDSNSESKNNHCEEDALVHALKASDNLLQKANSCTIDLQSIERNVDKPKAVGKKMKRRSSKFKPRKASELPPSLSNIEEDDSSVSSLGKMTGDANI